MRLCWRFSQQWQCLIASLPGNEIYIRGDAARRALHFPKHTHSSSVVISASAMLDCCHATYEQLVLKLCANSTAVNKQPSGQREQFLVGHAVISSRQIHRSSRDTRARTCAHLDASVLEHRSACTHRTHMHWTELDLMHQALANVDTGVCLLSLETFCHFCGVLAGWCRHN